MLGSIVILAKTCSIESHFFVLVVVGGGGERGWVGYDQFLNFLQQF